MIVVLQLDVHPALLFLQLLLKFIDYVAYFFLYLELYGIYMVLNRIEVLLFLLLPFQQTLNSFYVQHLTMDLLRCPLLPLQFTTNVLYTIRYIHYIQLMTIMLLLIPITVSTLLAKQRPTITFSLSTYIDQRWFFVLRTYQRYPVYRCIFKHFLNSDLLIILLL